MEAQPEVRRTDSIGQYGEPSDLLRARMLSRLASATYTRSLTEHLEGACETGSAVAPKRSRAAFDVFQLSPLLPRSPAPVARPPSLCHSRSDVCDQPLGKIHEAQ
jgi:hypothetical protein